jgi:hypothetical protein
VHDDGVAATPTIASDGPDASAAVPALARVHDDGVAATPVIASDGYDASAAVPAVARVQRDAPVGAQQRDLPGGAQQRDAPAGAEVVPAVAAVRRGSSESLAAAAVVARTERGVPARASVAPQHAREEDDPLASGPVGVEGGTRPNAGPPAHATPSPVVQRAVMSPTPASRRSSQPGPAAMRAAERAAAPVLDGGTRAGSASAGGRAGRSRTSTALQRLHAFGEPVLADEAPGDGFGSALDSPRREQRLARVPIGDLPALQARAAELRSTAARPGGATTWLPAGSNASSPPPAVPDVAATVAGRPTAAPKLVPAAAEPAPRPILVRATTVAPAAGLDAAPAHAGAPDRTDDQDPRPADVPRAAPGPTPAPGPTAGVARDPATAVGLSRRRAVAARGLARDPATAVAPSRRAVAARGLAHDPATAVAPSRPRLVAAPSRRAADFADDATSARAGVETSGAPLLQRCEEPTRMDPAALAGLTGGSLSDAGPGRSAVSFLSRDATEPTTIATTAPQPPAPTPTDSCSADAIKLPGVAGSVPIDDIYDRIVRRLRRELLDDRERCGRSIGEGRW